jgi:LacI family transcriptional regulator
MIRGRTDTLGIVVADIENPYFARAVRGATDEAARAGLHVILANTDEDEETERAAVKHFLERRVDGLIVAPAAGDHDHLRQTSESGLPVVLLDRAPTEVELDSVVADNREAAAAAVERLVAVGHRRIAAITSEGRPGRQEAAPEDAAWTTTERLAGYESSLPAGAEPLILHGGYERDGVRAMVAELMTSPTRPTALFTTDNVATLGTLDALRDLDVRIPEEVSVLGFDDPEWTTLIRPRLSVVRQPAADLGALAARVLLRRIEGSDEPATVHVLATTFVERESIGPAPA